VQVAEQVQLNYIGFRRRQLTLLWNAFHADGGGQGGVGARGRERAVAGGGAGVP